jgi:hypothetical protein
VLGSSQIEFPRVLVFLETHVLLDVYLSMTLPLNQIRATRNLQLGIFRAGIDSVIIPALIVLLGDQCLTASCNLSHIFFETGSKLKRIGSGAFRNILSQSVGMPSRLRAIGENCFHGPSVKYRIGFEADFDFEAIGNDSLRKLGLIAPDTFLAKVFTGKETLDV